MGNTPAERRKLFRDFFYEVLNAPRPETLEEDSLGLKEPQSLPREEDYDVSPFTIQEVKQAALRTSGNKATGIDGVPIEALRIPAVVEHVTKLMNEVMSTGKAPPEWLTSRIVAIPKKPFATKLDDHRGISLSSATAKLYNKVLLTRMQNLSIRTYALNKMASDHKEAQLATFSLSGES